MKNFILLFLITGIQNLESKELSQKDFDKAINTIQKKGYYSLTQDEIYQASLEGILNRIEQKHKNIHKKNIFFEKDNAYLNPEQSKNFNININGSVSGIGVKLEKKPSEKYPEIIKVFEGGAKKAGVLAGDLIVSIEGAPIQKENQLNDLVKKIRGKSGSSIQLEVLRNNKIKQLKITREKVTFPGVTSSIKNKTGILKILSFNKETEKKVKKALMNFKKKEINGIILDLSDSQGGDSTASENIASFFLEKNTPLWSYHFKNNVIKNIKSSNSGVFPKIKMIVIIGNKTSGVSEALTGVLKQRAHTFLIGEKTAGKASFEQLFSLEDGSNIKITSGMVYFPDQTTWHQKGVSPSLEIPLSNDLEKIAYQLLTKGSFM